MTASQRLGFSFRQRGDFPFEAPTQNPATTGQEQACQEPPITGLPITGLPDGGPEIFSYEDGRLFLIDLPQASRGFRRFISSWFFRDSLGRRILVDPGPASTIPLLNSGLETLTDDVDLVLLTHIHLDHAGGIGAFCRRWPNARVLGHPRGFTHLRDPRKLWSASVRTLGDVAEMYGEPEPLTAELLERDDAGIVETFLTPGHAPHHISMRVKSEWGRELFFVGEAAGMTCPTIGSEPSGPSGQHGGQGGQWLRPTSPPKFDAEAALSSMELLLSALHGTELMCYCHWGAAEDPVGRVTLALEQTRRWIAEIRSITKNPVAIATAADGAGDMSVDDIVEHMITADPLLNGSLPDDLLERERVFMRNSVKGIMLAIADA